MALVPNGMANDLGAVLNQFPTVDIPIFQAPEVVPDQGDGISSVLLAPLNQPPGGGNDRIRYITAPYLPLGIDNPQLASPETSLLYAVMDTPPAGQNPVFNPETDGQRAYPPLLSLYYGVPILTFEFTLDPAVGKTIYCVLARAAGDTATYTILPQSLAATQRQN